MPKNCAVPHSLLCRMVSLGADLPKPRQQQLLCIQFSLPHDWQGPGSCEHVKLYLPAYTEPGSVSPIALETIFSEVWLARAFSWLFKGNLCSTLLKGHSPAKGRFVNKPPGGNWSGGGRSDGHDWGGNRFSNYHSGQCACPDSCCTCLQLIGRGGRK